jgi:cytochrome o ubiquinol oxidase subunit III
MSSVQTYKHYAPNHHVDNDAVTVFGFWIYIMSDCILFACLFATFAALHTNTFGGPGPKDLFSLPLVFAETLILLTSSFTYGLGLLYGFKGQRNKVLILLFITFLLGLSFVSIEITEFVEMIKDGHSWQTSGFLSSFFALVATHGLHVSMGLIWMMGLMIQLWRNGLTKMTKRKLIALSLFWHFLDIVWIFVFSVVYLLGMV